MLDIFHHGGPDHGGSEEGTMDESPEVIIVEEDQEKEKMDEEYIRSLFEGKLGHEDTPEQKERKLQLLNEYLSDQFLERMSGLLMKHFTEKEQKLKLLLAKYGDQQQAETDAIKKNFKIEKEKLD